MNKIYYFLLLICLQTIKISSQNKSYNSIALEGEYKGKNLLVKNSFGKKGIGFCVTEVKVNGTTTKDEINAEMFQVKLDELKLNTGDKLRVEFIFQDSCTPIAVPMIMNLGAIRKNKGEKELVMMIDGKFKWANLFLLNPLLPDGTRSIKSVKVNKELITLNLKSEFTELPLIGMGLRKDNPVKDKDELLIEVTYTGEYDPLILNPEAVY